MTINSEQQYFLMGLFVSVVRDFQDALKTFNYNNVKPRHGTESYNAYLLILLLKMSKCNSTVPLHIVFQSSSFSQLKKKKLNGQNIIGIFSQFHPRANKVTPVGNTLKITTWNRLAVLNTTGG